MRVPDIQPARAPDATAHVGWLAKAPDLRNRYEAVEALLLLDDRSGEILRILRDSIRRPQQEPEGLTEFERLRFHDVDPLAARELIEQFDLSAAINER